MHHPDRFVRAYHRFWDWFAQHEKAFFALLGQKDNAGIHEDFFDRMSAKLDDIKADCYYFLAGMSDEHTAELIFSAEGNIVNFVFIEELVACAPALEGWKFIALKPAMDMEEFHIEMQGHVFNKDNLSFYADRDEKYPAETNIVILHAGLNKKNAPAITKGVDIFLGCCLGELAFATGIDHFEVVGKPRRSQRALPIGELGAFLTRRQEEGAREQAPEEVIPEEDQQSFSLLEGALQNGNPILAAVNTTLLGIKNRASYPWIAILYIDYAASTADNGMPDKETSDHMFQIEDDLQGRVREDKTCLYIGRETGNGEKQLFFACTDFRRISKLFYQIQDEYSDLLPIEYTIYKDRYWKTFRKFTREKTG
ncbi:MAG: DUF695 domain-containing protein [Zoogloeaceae bacterium]|jgi:hypothetical protein|nr:DUF695 domain-containing protein [Zoogloeaceae bacterium]